MKGAPRKVFLDKDSPVQLGPRVPKYVRDLIPRDANISREFTEFIIVKYGNPDQASLEDLKLKEIELREELSAVRGSILVIEAKIKREEDLRRSMEEIRRYVPHAFRKLVSRIQENGRHSITMMPEKIDELYGIAFDVNRVNEEFDSLSEEMEAMDDDYLVSRYSIQKGMKGTLENEIVREIRSK